MVRMLRLFYFNSFAACAIFANVLSRRLTAAWIVFFGSAPSVSRMNFGFFMSGCSRVYPAVLTWSSFQSSFLSALQSVWVSSVIVKTSLFFFSSRILTSTVVFLNGVYLYTLRFQ